MPKQSGIGQRLFANGYNISGDVGAVGSVATPLNLLDVTGLDKGAVERITGVADASMEFNCFFNPTSGAAHELLRELVGKRFANSATFERGPVEMLYLMGAAVDMPVFFMMGYQIEYGWSRGEDGSLSGTVSVQGSSETQRHNGTPRVPARDIPEHRPKWGIVKGYTNGEQLALTGLDADKLYVVHVNEPVTVVPAGGGSAVITAPGNVPYYATFKGVTGLTIPAFSGTAVGAVPNTAVTATATGTAVVAGGAVTGVPNVTVGEDGSDYATAPIVTVTIDAPTSGTQATATGMATISNGAVTAVTVSITNGGSGYSTATPPSVTIAIAAPPSNAVSGQVLIPPSGVVAEFDE